MDKDLPASAGPWVQFLLQEDPTGCQATTSMCHNWSLCSATKGAPTMRESPCTATETQHRQKRNQTTQTKMDNWWNMVFNHYWKTSITPSGGYFIGNRHPHQLLMKVWIGDTILKTIDISKRAFALAKVLLNKFGNSVSLIKIMKDFSILWSLKKIKMQSKCTVLFFLVARWLILSS